MDSYAPISPEALRAAADAVGFPREVRLGADGPDLAVVFWRDPRDFTDGYLGEVTRGPGGWQYDAAVALLARECGPLGFVHETCEAAVRALLVAIADAMERKERREETR